MQIFSSAIQKQLTIYGKTHNNDNNKTRGCFSFRTRLYSKWNAVAPVLAFSFLHLNLKQATTTAWPDNTVVSGDPRNQCHFFCPTPQPLAQQSQTLFFIASCKGNLKKGTSGRRKHCRFLFANLNMWNHGIHID
jgi:hypothetical protein